MRLYIICTVHMHIAIDLLFSEVKFIVYQIVFELAKLVHYIIFIYKYVKTCFYSMCFIYRQVKESRNV